MASKTVRWKALRIVIMLLMITWIISACSSTPPEPSQPPLPPQPTEAPEEGQTITLINPPELNNTDNEQSSKYQIQTRLTDFQLLSESEGIAWGVTKNELRLYMTQDNGLTWTKISPAPNVQFLSNPLYGKRIFFTDPSNGWIIRNAFGMTESIVLRTNDGGQTWKVSSLGEGNTVSSIYFNSPTHGWLMTSWNATAIKESKALFSTNDGGATWSKIMQNDHYNPNFPSDEIPISGVVTGMIFKDFSNGFVTLQTGALPKIYVTKDGGASWNKGPSFMENDHLENCDKVITGSPEFFDERSGWLSVSCQKDSDNSISNHGYFTADGGETWDFSPFALSSRTGINRHSIPTFINSQVGWTIDGNILYHTIDKGLTWKALPESSVLQSKLVEYPEIEKLQFYSSDVGWLLIGKKEDKRSILLQTTNGGVSWRVM